MKECKNCLYYSPEDFSTGIKKPSCDLYNEENQPSLLTPCENHKTSYGKQVILKFPKVIK